MTFVWDAKNNFILLHFITLHQQQSSTIDINWSSIVSDIRLEISSTPFLLKNQYKHLFEIFHAEKDSKSLYSTLKHIYLHSLCKKIEDNTKLTLEIAYELIRHVRAKRINTDDIQQLIKECNFNYSLDEEKENKKRLSDILNRLLDYTRNSLNNSSQLIYYHISEHSTTNEFSTIEKERNDEELESIPMNDNEKILIINKQNELINIDNNQLISNINEHEKCSFIRRRTQSLSLHAGNKDNKVNIGVEWFVPKLKRQQRSSSLHSRSASPINSSLSQDQIFLSNGILITAVDTDEFSDSTCDSNLRQTEDQPTVSRLPTVKEQIVEEEHHQQVESKFINGQRLDPVSSSDSDSIEIQFTTSPNNKASESLSSHDSHQQGNSSCKRRRLS